MVSAGTGRLTNSGTGQVPELLDADTGGPGEVDARHRFETCGPNRLPEPLAGAIATAFLRIPGPGVFLGHAAGASWLESCPDLLDRPHLV